MRAASRAIALLAFAISIANAPARADVANLAPSDVVTKTPAPARYLRTLAFEPSGYDPQRNVVATDLLLGDLLFHSPAVLGDKAKRIGLSCNGCHPNGATNDQLVLGTLSDRPGNVDLTTATFRTGAENHIADAVSIPSLRGARFTAPYGHDGRTTSLAEQIDGVVANEFGGAPLSRAWSAALVRYVQDLDFLPNANLDARGRITPRAGDAARRGEALFGEPRAGFSGLSCASCHPASTFFRDGKVHRLGSGKSPAPHATDGGEKTPTLLGTAESAPYFHDGRFATLADVIAWFDTSFDLRLSARDRADLTAYVVAVGAVDTAKDDRTLAQKLIATFVFLELLVAGDAMDDRRVWSMALDACARQLAAQSPPPTLADRVARDKRALAVLASRAEAGEPLAPMRSEVKDLSRELTRLAADWQGSL